jgi:nitrogen fixation protein NifU and related proteins
MGQFSEILMDHFNSPRNYGRIETPDRVGIAGTPGLGPYVAFYLRLAGDVISEARFQTHGCGVSIACGSMLTEMITGRAAGDCLELTPEHLAEWRGSDPALQPIMLLDLPVKVRSWELTVYPRSHIRR